MYAYTHTYICMYKCIIQQYVYLHLFNPLIDIHTIGYWDMHVIQIFIFSVIYIYDMILLIIIVMYKTKYIVQKF